MKSTHLIAITITGIGLLIVSMFKNSWLQILGGLCILFGLIFSVYNDVKKDVVKINTSIILDDNELSLMMYAEEYPENWKKICGAIEEKTKCKAL